MPLFMSFALQYPAFHSTSTFVGWHSHAACWLTFGVPDLFEQFVSKFRVKFFCALRTDAM